MIFETSQHRKRIRRLVNNQTPYFYIQSFIADGWNPFSQTLSHFAVTYNELPTFNLQRQWITGIDNAGDYTRLDRLIYINGYSLFDILSNGYSWSFSSENRIDFYPVGGFINTGFYLPSVDNWLDMYGDGSMTEMVTNKFQHVYCDDQSSIFLPAIL